jgi:hypothetical protein
MQTRPCRGEITIVDQLVQQCACVGSHPLLLLSRTRACALDRPIRTH